MPLAARDVHRSLPSQRWRIRLSTPSLPPHEQFAAALEGVWERRWLSNDGPQAQAFARSFARVCGDRRPTRSVSSADVALTLLLRALDLPKGSRVVLPSLGYPSTVHAAEWNGLRPVFVDVDPDDWCLHASGLEGDLGDVALIIATHLYGVPADVAGLERLAEQLGARLVFDAAHAVASWVGERHVTEYGDASVVSFSATKAVTAGEGAIAVCREPGVADRLGQLCAYGLDDRQTSVATGLNGKLSELDATLGLLSLGRLEELLRIRSRLVECYRAGLADVAEARLQVPPPGTRSTPTYMVVELTRDRERVRETLAARGIETRLYFPPLHQMPRLAGLPRTALAVTERLARGLLALPLHTELTEDQVQEICAAVREGLNPGHAPRSGGG